MPFSAEPPPIIRVEKRTKDDCWVQQSATDSMLYFDTTKQLIRSFFVGDIKYQLRQRLEASYEPPIANKQGRFLVPQLAKVAIGRGSELQSAKYDWELKIDEKIQTLLAKQDFERSEQDSEDWEMLNRHFNLSEMKYATPSDVRVFGRLEKIRGHVRQVRWLDGSITKFRRHQIPAQMVTFKPGQPFEAVLQRDNRNWKAIKISSVFPRHSLPEVSQEEAEAIFERIPSNADAPTLDF